MFTNLLKFPRRIIPKPRYRTYSTALALSPDSSAEIEAESNPTNTQDPSIKSEPVILPPAPSKPRHNDLQTYLSTTSPSRIDTTYIGTKYEYTVQSSLSRLGFTLTHNGGSSDYGIDLLGTWNLPFPSNPIPQIKILIQCKSHARPARPHIIRELEGTFAGAPIAWRRERGATIAFLASTKHATKGVREALGRSFCPVGFLCVDGEGGVKQMLWNRRAEEVGLVGVGVGVRYEEGDGVEKGVVELVWRGVPVGEFVEGEA